MQDVHKIYFLMLHLLFFFIQQMVTKHTSTNLEEINKKIARILQDPTQAIDHMSINVDEMTWSQLKEFADKGNNILNRKELTC